MHSLKKKQAVFRCAVASLYEVVSVRPSVGPSVRLSRVIFSRVLGASCAVYPALLFSRLYWNVRLCRPKCWFYRILKFLNFPLSEKQTYVCVEHIFTTRPIPMYRLLFFCGGGEFGWSWFEIKRSVINSFLIPNKAGWMGGETDKRTVSRRNVEKAGRAGVQTNRKSQEVFLMNALWVRIIKNPDEELCHLFVHLLVCSHHSLIRLLRTAHSLTSLTPLLVGKWLIRWLFCLCFFYILAHSAGVIMGSVTRKDDGWERKKVIFIHLAEISQRTR